MDGIGKDSKNVITLDDMQSYAAKMLPKFIWDYYSSGANAEHTLRRNRTAFNLYSIRPKVLANISKPVLNTSVQGTNIPFPICIAPTALQCLCHTEGELATSKVCSYYGTCMCLSTSSTKSLEEVYSVAGLNPVLWFQIYVFNDWELTSSLIKRAERTGFKAFVLTVDANVLGQRYNDQKNKFSLPSHLKFGNLLLDDMKNTTFKGECGSGLEKFMQDSNVRNLGWDIIAKIKSITSLPLIVKGIQTPEDALLAVQYKVDGIWISNHGGRQLDTVDASIEMLDEISQVLDTTQIEVYVDGGIRHGTDILKALALGARAVFIGRPVLYGLTYDGDNGVKLVLEILKNELEMAMAFSGCNSVRDINRKLICKKIQTFQSNL